MIARVRPLTFGEALTGARFLWSLRTFLRQPVESAEAQAIVRRRLQGRAADLLVLVREAIYGHPASPYRRLLARVGCEYGDVERLVSTEGLEGALHVLFGHGVFLTVDELKGRRPVVRGSATLTVVPDQLRNPVPGAHVWARTSGSRSPGTPVPFNLAFVRDGAVNKRLPLEARGGLSWSHAHWDVPGGAMASILGYAKAGAVPIRWFSPVAVTAPELDPRYRWSARAMRWGGWLSGVSLPRPEHVPLDDPRPIAHWLRETLEAGGVPHLITYPSPAVRLCQTAVDAGIPLHGTHFTLYGEPLTHARLRVIRNTGADAAPVYVATETGRIGEGCLAPDSPDDLHLYDDLHALIQPGAAGDSWGLPPEALLVSSLRRTAPLILLNVSMGDLARVSRRVCGCPLERLGWTTHLCAVRSFEKLTAGGMTFLDTDLIRVLEEVLPAQFGGAPTDYQLVEEESSVGHPRVRLLVHPALGPLDPQAVAEAFLAAIGAGAGAERLMGLVWRDAKLLRVERQPPLTTASGKIQHLHVEGHRRSLASDFQSGDCGTRHGADNPE